jgi:hypothetical protein
MNATRTRDLEQYLQALWGGRFRVRFADAQLPRGAFDEREQVLPAELEGASRLARARAAHAAAHAAFSGERFDVGSLKPLQQVLVSLFEDARVETLAMRRFPGLRRLWAPFHRATPSPNAPLSALLARLARALFDDAYADADAWIQKARALFWAAEPAAFTPQHSRRLGSLLGNDLGQMRLSLDARQYLAEPAYRDDHSGLWLIPPSPARAAEPAVQPAGGASSPPSGSATHSYPEWDYVIGRERSAFCAVSDERAAPARTATPLPPPAPLVRRLRQNLRRALRVTQLQRRTSDGPLLDLNAVVEAAAERASQRSSALRVYRRPQRKPTSSSVILLLDLSESSNADLARGYSARELAAACARLLCAAPVPGVSLAIHGFSSYGRRDVRYTRFKDFSEPAAAVVERLGELHAAGSTRLGAAVRRAGAQLRSRVSASKLLLIVTDGDPADVDVYDAKYLVEDARAAVDGTRRLGIGVFACCLPGGEGPIQRRIFGRHRAPLERLQDLPARLQAAYSAGRGGPA